MGFQPIKSSPIRIKSFFINSKATNLEPELHLQKPFMSATQDNLITGAMSHPITMFYNH